MPNSSGGYLRLVLSRFQYWQAFSLELTNAHSSCRSWFQSPGHDEEWSWIYLLSRFPAKQTLSILIHHTSRAFTPLAPVFCAPLGNTQERFTVANLKDCRARCLSPYFLTLVLIPLAIAITLRVSRVDVSANSGLGLAREDDNTVSMHRRAQLLRGEGLNN